VVVGDPKSARFWQPVAQRMEATVLLYNCTGHGASAKPAQIASELRKLLK
jgi:hypothetical protein